MNSPLSDSPSTKPYLTIRPSSGWAALNVRQLWLFRDLLFTLAQRDVKLRYKQTALGVLWVIIQPLLAAGILTFVFGKIAAIPPPGKIPYFLFSYAGTLAFGAFSSTITKSSGSLIGNSQLISKVFFPRLLLPLSSVFSTLLDFAVALCVMVVLMVIYRISPTVALLTMPIWLALMLMLALGVGLIAAALTVTYRDVQYILPVVVTFLTWASPVGYSVALVMEKLSPSVRPWYFVLNPLASLIEAFRWSLLGQGVVPWNYVAYSSLLAVSLFVLGAFSFKKMERKFADVI